MRYRQFGFEGLIDCRLPEPIETVPEDIRQAICRLRRADPELGVEAIVSFIGNHHERNVSASSVKRILKRSGLNRACGRPKQSTNLRGKALMLGGMKLVEAAAVSTGYLASLTTSVVDHIASLPTPEGALGPDVNDRDELGRFVSSYNERYSKGDTDAVGPGFSSVELKRELKDPSLFHVHGASPSVVERKLWALMCSPVIGSGEWDGMRTPRGALLEELCGFAYMPATLSLFTTELKYAGVSSVLWETHACTWHSETQNWGSPRHAAVLYVDGSAKGIFTRLFSQTTHVSLWNRNMPGLDVVGFHTGYGVPLWYLGHSGRAPLVKAVPEAITKLENQIGAQIGRIVVIDAEGNSAPFLNGLEQEGRGWVTRLRPCMVENKSVINWTPFRPYRDNDRIREGELELRLDKKETLGVRLLEIERRSSGNVVHLAASKILRTQDWPTTEVADLYFARWPNQELNFRAVNQATDFKQVHGYGKRLVANVAVTTRLDKVGELERNATARYNKQSAHLESLNQRFESQSQAIEAAQQRKDEIDGAFDTYLTAPVVQPSVLRELHQERKASEVASAKAHLDRNRTIERHNKVQAQLERTEQALQKYQNERFDLEERTEILAHDTELDSIFNVLKVGLTLLVTFVLRTMLDNARMSPVTFLERIATLHARQRITRDYEHITFEYNRRDPKVMALLIANCDAINALRLPMRSGRILRVAVEDSPEGRSSADSS